ncbi:MAG: AAA family ATPase [Thiotrichaceae bacterium]|nr:AAA family ATPase [Thiotrichaceae bacterium]
MNPHFLTNIHIKQFKCFTDFKAEGFKRVNLIGGKNNVGKTAFIEACYINVSSVISAISNVGFRRERLNLTSSHFTPEEFNAYLERIQQCDISSNVKEFTFSFEEQDEKKVFNFKMGSHKPLSIAASEASFSMSPPRNIRYIDSHGYLNSSLLDAFSDIQKKDKETELNKFVSQFDSNIETFKVISEQPQCKMNGEYRHLSECGDGLLQYIAIICTLYAGADGYLFIDEIDNGIHYSQLDRLWEIIFTLSKQTNCQVFATTHSKEMLESFARVARKLDEHEISYTTLAKNKQNIVKALTLDYEMLLMRLDQAHEIR